MEFNKSQIYSSRIQHIALPDFSGSPQEKYDNFFKTILEYFTSLKLDDMHLDSAEINIGGSFFTKKIGGYSLSYNSGGFNLASFYFATHNGNVFNYSLYKQAKLGFFDALAGVNNPEDKVTLIKSKLDTIKDVEEFSLLDAVSDILYDNALKSIS